MLFPERKTMLIINNESLQPRAASYAKMDPAKLRAFLSRRARLCDSWGEDLENWYELYEFKELFIIVKNCQSVHGWHVAEFYDSSDEAAARMQYFRENDGENLFALEMQQE